MAIACSLLCCQRLFLVSRRLLQLSSFFFSTPTPAAVKAKAETSLLHPSSFQSLCPNRHRETLAAARTLCRQFSSSQSNTTNSPAAFDYSSEEEEEASNNKTKMKTKTKEKSMDKSKLPPPYDPFNNNRKRKNRHHHTVEEEEEEDPKDLQAIFHKMRTEGLVPNAIKMFDALSKDGLTNEALELFSLIKDKGSMPDVVAHTAVVEAYANAGQPKEALRVFIRMLASGVRSNAYTYSVLIRGLAADSRTLPDAKRHLLEMMDDGIRPNAATYTAVFEAFFARGEEEQKRLDEARQLLEQMRDKGFVPDERAVRDHLAANKRGGQVFRTFMNLLFDKTNRCHG
ncbi:hypothetical protein MRB53_032131 [Persea americana]|uniref:Uncharacterized protein n=1 Tax=Persea americana TaxID=3435 RepID=A0ACC2KRC5_PERAE|nr:hypothetical protein MRB53_032131 [Persea americana]